MDRKIWIAMAGVAALALVAALRPTGALVAQGKSYGFIDMEYVLNNYAKNAELTETLGAKYQEIVDARRKGENDLQLEREEMATFAGSKRAEAARLIAMKEFSLKFDYESEMRELEKKKIDGWKTLYVDIQEAAEKVSRDRGLDAVLVMNRSEPDGKSDQDMIAQITLRQVLYFDSSLDVTEAVLRLLNR